MDMPKLIDSVLKLIYPPRCPFCRRLLKDGEELVCRDCRKDILRVPDTEMRRDIKNTELCVFPLYYENSVRDSLIRYKFNGLNVYGKAYAEYIASAIEENDVQCDLVTWVPLSRKRLRKRGYDQAEILAEETAKLIGRPCEGLLRKLRDNKPQSSTASAKERRENAAGAYSLSGSTDMKGKTVLIIDDIVTTGSTLSECAEVLKSGGCTAVYAAAAAGRR